MAAKIFRNQIFYYFLFLAVLLVPNAALCITEPYTWNQTLANLLIPFGGYALLLLLTQRPGIMAYISFPFMFFGAFQLVLLYLFGNSIIAVDMFTNLFTTNATEAGELLGNLWPAVAAVCILYIPTLVAAGYSLRLKDRLKPHFRRRMLLVATGAVLCGYGIGFFAQTEAYPFAARYQVFPINVLYNLKLTFVRWAKSENYPETSREFTFNARKERWRGEREIYVLVIGEASRAPQWSLFGYERKTTPHLDTLSGIVPFRDALTQANATHKSVPIILAPASAENFDEIFAQKSLIAAFRESGFHTVFISNQVPNRSLIDFFSEEADRRIDVSPHTNTLITDNRPDGEMLPALRQVIRETTGDLLVVMHTYGSHFNYKMRYPDGFGHYTPDYASSIGTQYKKELVNSYDNSVLYTDHVLNEIASVLDSTQACTALLYSADHGEDILDDGRKRFLHASPIPTYYQLHVACFAWFSETYRNRYPKKAEAALRNKDLPTSTAAVFHTLVDMAGIETEMLDTTRSLVNDGFQARERLYLNDHDQAVPVYAILRDKEDFEAMDRHGIRYDKSRVDPKKLK